MKKINTSKLALSGVLIALGIVMSTFYVPIGGSKVFPVQHLLNVVAACTLGPAYAVLNAFVISLLRNMLGMGTLLAFPGSMIGAFLASVVYRRFKNFKLSALGEFIGTGIIGGILSAPVFNLFMGGNVNMLFFIVPFAASSLLGSVLAIILLEGSSSLRKWLVERKNEA